MSIFYKAILSGVAFAGAFSVQAQEGDAACAGQTNILTRAVLDNGEVWAYPNLIATHNYCDGGTVQISAKLDNPSGSFTPDSARLFSATYSNNLPGDVSYKIGLMLPLEINNGDFGIYTGLPLGNADVMQLDAGLVGGYFQKSWKAGHFTVIGRAGAFIRPVEALNDVGWNLPDSAPGQGLSPYFRAQVDYGNLSARIDHLDLNGIDGSAEQTRTLYTVLYEDGPFSAMAEYTDSTLNGRSMDTYSVIAAYEDGWFRSATAFSDRREVFEVGAVVPVFERCRINMMGGPERDRMSGESRIGYSAQWVCNFTF